MQAMLRKYARFILPVIVILLGLLVMVALAKSRKKVQRTHKEFAGALVEIINVQNEDKLTYVEGNGTVAPRYEVTLMPQVSGKIVWMHPDFEAGGGFRECDTLLKIETIDYELAVDQAEAAVAQAEYALQVAKANADIAKKEWDMVKNGNSDLLGQGNSNSTPDALVLHEPQLKQAEANYASAQASLERAKLNLARTSIMAPFNGRIRSRNVSLGQIVGQSTSIAKMYATDIVEIAIGLPVGELAWINIPGSEVDVIQEVGNNEYIWHGRVDRKVGVVDQIGRLEQVIVQVKNPLKTNGDAPELSIGSFVKVQIKGETLKNIITVPRKAIRENSTIWIADAENKLRIREINIYRQTPDEALITEGIDPGEAVVLTSIAGASDGMKLRPVEEGQNQ